MTRASGTDAPSLDLSEARRADTISRAAGLFTPEDHKVGDRADRRLRRRGPTCAATLSIDAEPSGSRKVVSPSYDRLEQLLGVGCLDDPLALATPKVEPHVALVLAGHGDRPGRLQSAWT